MFSEAILEVGADGGSLTVFGERAADGKWSFRLARNELMLYESEGESGGRDLYIGQSEHFPSIQDALILMDKYPWHRLHPIEIHPEFFDAILSEVRKRGGEEEESRWRGMMKHRLPPRNGIHPLTVGVSPAYGVRMPLKNQLTGMLGVYLTAAELTAKGFIVSPTSRSAFGADLLVTDQRCQNAWSVQVKTNWDAKPYWLLNQHAEKLKSESHLYVFVNIKRKDPLDRPDYLVVRSREVAENVSRDVAKSGRHGAEGGSVWYSFPRIAKPKTTEGWEVFGNPMPPEAEDPPTPREDSG
jgi:hypothetical protein